MLEDAVLPERRLERAFQHIVGGRVARREAIWGALAAASTLTLGEAEGRALNARNSLLRFRGLPAAQARGREPGISPDYDYHVLIPWGDPLLALPAPPSGADVSEAERQAWQIGVGHDGMHLFAERMQGGMLRSDRGLLCINHELGSNIHVLGRSLPASLEDVRRSQHAHGVSVVSLAQSRGRWHQVPSHLARRIHVNTPVVFTGPAAGHALLGPSMRPAFGTVNNCSCGHTPWGTYLTCEENIDGYFGSQRAIELSPAQKRYGFSRDGFGYGWHHFDPRFDLASELYHGEEHRFGWVVEIDPMRPSAPPVKRTALGRFKHEGAAVTETEDHRVVVYMGDDQRFDYVYKFVSADNWSRLRAAGMSPLDHGTLYAAQFLADGTGLWHELSLRNARVAAQFSDMGTVVTWARLAADVAGATPMDRPEWMAVASNGDVYCSLTNNHERTSPGVANPFAPNADGHILRIRPAAGHGGLRFSWELFASGQQSIGTEAAFGSPDSLMMDPDGRLFVATDGKQPGDINNQLLVADTGTGEMRRLFAGVPGSEITGLTSTPDRRTLFVNVQHPGDGDPAKTSFPARYDGVTHPRDATVAIQRKDGGIVGS